MVGVCVLVIFGTAFEWSWLTSQPRRCCMPWEHTKSNETNPTSSLTNVNIKNVSNRRPRFYQMNHQIQKKFGHSSSGIDITMTVVGGMNSDQ